MRHTVSVTTGAIRCSNAGHIEHNAVRRTQR
jgi:hypothetical protein